MTGKERIARQLKRLPVDRIGATEEFWEFTHAKWVRDGKIEEGTNLVEHFDFDLDKAWAVNLTIDPHFKDVVLEENDETRLVLNGNGAKLRYYKTHASTPEHIGYSIESRGDWLEKAKPFLIPSIDRVNCDWYRHRKKQCDDAGRFFFASGINCFESMRNITSHENFLMAMALEPEWVKDMADTYADLFIGCYDEIFAREGKPDGVWIYEDLGFKGRPFMSPEMFRELILPAYKKTIDWAHGLGLPLVLHSCGFVQTLVPDLVRAGLDALQAMEVKAGVDMLKLYADYGDVLSFIGGLDARPIASNDLPGIKRELEAKIPIVKGKHGFILHSDHSIPESTEYETYKYFLELGRELGAY
ncbi:MAG: hypothetical protein FWG05_06295 [Kiritimatiellaeota bacterium]|nr:hypothetical protein [Kiritimatiellota bacterium]